MIELLLPGLAVAFLVTGSRESLRGLGVTRLRGLFRTALGAEAVSRES